MASKDRAGIPCFAQVAPGLYRGGQPSEEGYQYLKSLGIKTVVSFRHEREFIEQGKKAAEEYGLRYINIPWTIYGRSREEVLNQFFAVVEDDQNRPLFLYCKRGVERTGVMVALYLMRYEGLSSKEAYQKAFDGFPVKWIWKPFVCLKFDYFKKRLPPT